MLESKEQLQGWVDTVHRLKEEIGRIIVGQQEVTEQLLWCILAGGHALLEGIPGLGKTMLVRTLADALELQFSRIQFTPDLMPSDITGTNILQPSDGGGSRFRFQQGPLFGNLILADEINRATPKTQSALLEAMQEQTVTAGTETYRLPRPFFVLATQNPLEQEGTYPLPEAQLDRFLLKINVSFPSREELKEIVIRTTSAFSGSPDKVAGGAWLEEVRQGAKEILLAEEVLDYAVRLLLMTHPEEPEAPGSVKQYVRFGSGPRGIQSIISTAKVRALMAGRLQVSYGDIRATAVPALRHRLILNFEGQASGISPDLLVQDILDRLESSR
ncbi:AAA family ATPase [Gorillibacterium sp. sgz5001074]|uniref:AAA family ATPase n=1 Tax=Gorillibacterium sp. sgz5001074 TaxID=3446695 RepID=UPI003F67871F